MLTTLDLASKISPHVALRSVRLSSMSLQSGLGETVSSALTIVGGHDASGSQANKKIDVAVDFEFAASIANEDASSSEELLNLKARLILSYDLATEDEFSADSLQSFAELNGVYNAWPYWREICQSTCARAGLHGIVAPVFRPTPRTLEDSSTN